MNRQAAQNYLGKPMVAWTAANGSYAGLLVEILPTRPWRARVKITGVLACTAFEYGRPLRRGFRPGDVIEVGGVNCKPTTPETPLARSYSEVLGDEISKVQEYANNPGGRNVRLWSDMLVALETALEREATACHETVGTESRARR